jgi:hypothetical protein
MIATRSNRLMPTRFLTSRNVTRAGLIALAALALAGCGKHERPRADLAESRITTIGVNGWLWRASLETLSFMPLLQTDSAGGVIVTPTRPTPANGSR